MTKIRLGLVAGLVAATLAPVSAHASIFCRPWITWNEVTVAGQTYQVPEYHGMVC
jgi:hypothetical protein